MPHAVRGPLGRTRGAPWPGGQGASSSGCRRLAETEFAARPAVPPSDTAAAGKWPRAAAVRRRRAAVRERRPVRASVAALQVLAVAREVQGAKLGGRPADHVAFADQDLVGEVRQRAAAAAVRPAHDDVAAALARGGLLDAQHLDDGRVIHGAAERSRRSAR